MTKIAVLVSGGGTNLQALIDAQTSGVLKSGTLSLVIANKADAYALTRARNAGIETAVVLKKDCGSAEAFEEKIRMGGVLEYTEYCGNYYGTLKSEFDRAEELGKHLIL